MLTNASVMKVTGKLAQAPIVWTLMSVLKTMEAVMTFVSTLQAHFPVLAARASCSFLMGSNARTLMNVLKLAILVLVANVSTLLVAILAFAQEDS